MSALTVSKEDEARVKGMGFLNNRGTDLFSARVLTVNGKVTAAQHRCMAEAAEKFGNGNLLYTAMLIARSNGVVVTKFMQKEAAALITKAAEIEWVREKMLAVRRLFFFCRHAAIIMFFYFTKLSNSCEFVSTNFLIVLSLLRITFKHTPLVALALQ